MGLKWSEPPRNCQETVFQDSLKHLFRCGQCATLLVDQIIFAMVGDGKLTDLMCPCCHRLWAFARMPNELMITDQLTRDNVHLLDHSLASNMGIAADPCPADQKYDRVMEQAKQDAARHALASKVRLW